MNAREFEEFTCRQCGENTLRIPTELVNDKERWYCEDCSDDTGRELTP